MNKPIKKLYKNNLIRYNYTLTRQYLLHKIITSAEYLSSNELLKSLQYCIPDAKELRNEILNDILTLLNKHKFKNLKRYPVVLIIDEVSTYFIRFRLPTYSTGIFSRN